MFDRKGGLVIEMPEGSKFNYCIPDILEEETMEVLGSGPYTLRFWFGEDVVERTDSVVQEATNHLVVSEGRM